MLSDYWMALTAKQRIGFIAGLTMIVVGVGGVGVLLLRDPNVPLAPGLSADRAALVAKELEQAKIGYRVAEDGSLEVPRSMVGKARAVASAGGLGLPPNVGLELFKETDFSTTDFAQKVNYQRALQGELTRTIQTLAGVQSVRAHVILPEAGLLRRQTGKATAAVGVTMAPGRSLSPNQARGIQRIVVASVPDIKPDDVVVFNEAGTSLVRGGTEMDGEMPSSQLDLKRQVDGYLEAKLGRLLQELAPQGGFSVSVDASLDYKQVKLTTDEPIAAPMQQDAEHAMGVVVKERQTQRVTPGNASEGRSVASVDNSESEFEYKVGHRVEQTLSLPGAVKRLSVAVVVRGADPKLSSSVLEQLLSHAVGVDRSRGDSVSVLIVPSSEAVLASPSGLVERPQPKLVSASEGLAFAPSMAGIWPYALLLMFAGTGWWAFGKARKKAETTIAVETATAKVKTWLEQGPQDAAG